MLCLFFMNGGMIVKKRTRSKYLFEKELRKTQIFSGILNLFSIPFHLLTAFLISRMVTLATEGQVWKVGITGGFLAGEILICHVGTICMKTRYEKSAELAKQNCKRQLYESFFNNSLSTLYRLSLGTALENLTNDFETVIKRILINVPVIWTSAAELLILSVYVGCLSPLALAVVLVIAMLQMFPPLIVKKYMQINYDNCREIEGEITDFTITAFNGLLVIKMYQLQEWWLGKLEKLYKRYKRIGNQSIYAAESEGLMYGVLDQILKYGTYCAVAALVLLHVMPTATGIQVIALSASVYSAFKNMVSNWPDIAVARTAEERLERWYPGGQTSGEDLKSAEICLEKVAFSYEDTILNKVSAQMDGKKKNIIKGKNGIGKSTLFRLLLGMEKIQSGVITVGGVPPEKIKADAFPHKIMYLPQDDPAFEMNAMELYDFVLKEQKEKAITYATRFGLSEDILENQTIAQLSGGERKKVFLSLAFSSQSTFLFLDEPTNHLDENGRAMFAEFFKEYPGGVFVITHENQLDACADYIWTMGKGGLKIEKQSSN